MVSWISQEVLLQDWKTLNKITDGCSFPHFAEWLNESRFCDICKQHDFWYAYGEKYGISRLVADRELRDSLIDIGAPFKARVVYIAVRVCGSSYWSYYKDYKRRL